MNMHVSMDSATHALWDATIAKHEIARQASDLYNTSVHDPLWKELEQTAPRPSLSFEIEALDGQITHYRVDPANLHAWDDHWSPVIRRKAAAIREAWLVYRETHERLGLPAVNEESDRLCEAQCAIESTLMKMPAPDPSALLWKLERLFGPEAWDGDDFAPSWCADWMNAVMTDARCLLSAQASLLFAWPEAETIMA